VRLVAKYYTAFTLLTLHFLCQKNLQSPAETAARLRAIANIGKVVLVVTVGDVAVDSCWSRACNASLYERCRVVDAVAGCSCPALCDRVVKPVCASDGHTYDSLCHL